MDRVRQTTRAVRVGSRRTREGVGVPTRRPTFAAKPPTTAAALLTLNSLDPFASQIRANIAINMPMAAAAKKRIILGYLPKHP